MMYFLCLNHAKACPHPLPAFGILINEQSLTVAPLNAHALCPTIPTPANCAHVDARNVS
jgi:hypothetical protein